MQTWNLFYQLNRIYFNAVFSVVFHFVRWSVFSDQWSLCFIEIPHCIPVTQSLYQNSLWLECYVYGREGLWSYWLRNSSAVPHFTFNIMIVLICVNYKIIVVLVYYSCSMLAHEYQSSVRKLINSGRIILS